MRDGLIAVAVEEQTAAEEQSAAEEQTAAEGLDAVGEGLGAVGEGLGAAEVLFVSQLAVRDCVSMQN